jgi:hypothetical protein
LLCCAVAFGLVASGAAPVRAEAGTEAAQRILRDGFEQSPVRHYSKHFVSKSRHRLRTSSLTEK